MQKAREIIEEERHLFIKEQPFSEQKEVERRLEKFINLARQTIVPVGDRKRPQCVSWEKASELWTAQALNRNPQEIHLVVHEDWPSQSGNEQLRNECLPAGYPLPSGDIQSWIKQYETELREAIEGKKHCKVVENGKKDCFAKDIVSVREDNEVSGYMAPWEIAKFFRQNNGFLIKDRVHVHGATYGCCPQNAMDQIAASVLGIYLPPDTENIPYAKKCFSEQEYLDFFSDLAFASIFPRSGITAGIMMDCRGFYPRQKEGSSILRGTERIYPWCLTEAFATASSSPL